MSTQRSTYVVRIAGAQYLAGNGTTSRKTFTSRYTTLKCLHTHGQFRPVTLHYLTNYQCNTTERPWRETCCYLMQSILLIVSVITNCAFSNEYDIRCA
jgi:hypothetical protein